MVLVLVSLAILLPALAVILYSRVDQAAPADVIVLLGAGLEPGDRPSRSMTRRLQQVAELFHRGLASQVICSGGTGAGRSRSEAAVCGDFLQQQGIPADAILLEEGSRSTEENARFSAALIEARGWQRVILVSDGYHLLRARLLFERFGQPVLTSPAAHPPPGPLVWNTLREVAVLYWLGLRYLFNIPELLLQVNAGGAVAASVAMPRPKAGRPGAKARSPRPRRRA
ncbi:MAG: YdcF family protein [Anaerolineaceae bacterium]|nr:YdcF family protein [Anaerolineaceae bacterium]